MRTSSILLLVGLAHLAVSQQIREVVRKLSWVFDKSKLNSSITTSNLQWQTTWDRSRLFRKLPLPSPINFTSPGPIAGALIVVDDKKEYQTILGFGGALSNSLVVTIDDLPCLCLVHEQRILLP